jgi:hypothetical protein
MEGLTLKNSKSKKEDSFRINESNAMFRNHKTETRKRE